MTQSEAKIIGEIFIKIGQKINERPDFISTLYKLLDMNTNEKEREIFNKNEIDAIDFYNLAKNNGINEIDKILNSYNVPQLKFICKKYHFSIPTKSRTEKSLRDHIINQFSQRSTDVFINKEKSGDSFTIIPALDKAS
jgi:hypothetical protein